MCISPTALLKVLICMQWGWEPGKDVFWLRLTHVTMAAPRKCINIYEKGTKKSRHFCLPFWIYSFYKFNFGATSGGIDTTTVTARQKCMCLMFSCNWESWCWFLFSEIVIFSTFLNITFFYYYLFATEKTFNKQFLLIGYLWLFLLWEVQGPLFFLKSKDPPVSIATTVSVWLSIFFTHETVLCKTDLLPCVQWANSQMPRGGISSLGVGGNFHKSNTATQVSSTYS